MAVDITGVRGFCPMSQIESGFCADPSVYVGRTLEFVVTSVEEGRGSVVLSRRQFLRRGEEGSFKYIPAIDILQKNIKKDELKGCIILTQNQRKNK